MKRGCVPKERSSGKYFAIGPMRAPGSFTPFAPATTFLQISRCSSRTRTIILLQTTLRLARRISRKPEPGRYRTRKWSVTIGPAISLTSKSTPSSRSTTGAKRPFASAAQMCARNRSVCPSCRNICISMRIFLRPCWRRFALIFNIGSHCRGLVWLWSASPRRSGLVTRVAEFYPAWQQR